MTDDLTETFASGYAFTFDEFQTNACRALERSESVLVAAPTGSGKTVVGEFAVWLALRFGRKAFYTTPLKALSNQKFADLCAIHGADRVGLLTGDNSINAQAPVVIMTTEVLRNMIYERSDLLLGLRFVVLDEVHYLQDRYRGAVWEEVIIHLPVDVQIVSLSATVSNAEEFADWIQTLRGPTAVVIEERRPIALEQHFLVEGKIIPLFVGQPSEGKINPQIRRIHGRKVGSDRGRGSRVQRSDVVELMDGMDMLPAIYFIFSRKGCDSAVDQCIREGIRLIDRQQAATVRQGVEERFQEFDDSDLEVLGYERWLSALTKGVAAHHAGLIPAFKETVEELFLSGLIKVVFATETLSLGINMPARTVFIESLFHFTGDQHEMLTPGSFTQLTGRAGRRGIDIVGHSVVPAQREVTVQQIAGLATTRTFPLRSSFEPSYNMTANLVRNYSMDEAEHLLNSSFGQYQADSSVVVLEKLMERNRAYMMSYREKMACDLGDFSDYLTLVERLERTEREAGELLSTERATTIRNFLATLRPGDAFFSRGGKVRGPALVVATDRSRRGDPRILVLTPDRRLSRLIANDLLGPARVARLPDRASIKSLSGSRSIPSLTRRALASQLASLDLLDDQIQDKPSLRPPETIELSRAVEDHPCHSCPDRSRHMQWAQRLKRLEREESGLLRRIDTRTQTLSKGFEEVVKLLEEFGYVKGSSLADKGLVLARIYNENDLLLSECLERGWLDDLTSAEVAAVISTFVFENRGPYETTSSMPTSRSRAIFDRVSKLFEQISSREKRAGLALTRGVDPGGARAIHSWCGGAPLEDVVDPASGAGDFIRVCRQTIDLLKQVRQEVRSDMTRDRISASIEGLDRGIVAYVPIPPSD